MPLSRRGTPLKYLARTSSNLSQRSQALRLIPRWLAASEKCRRQEYVLQPRVRRLNPPGRPRRQDLDIEPHEEMSTLRWCAHAYSCGGPHHNASHPQGMDRDAVCHIKRRSKSHSRLAAEGQSNARGHGACRYSRLGIEHVDRIRDGKVSSVLKSHRRSRLSSQG